MLDRDSASLAARTGMGFVSLHSDRLVGAREHFETVLEANPDLTDALVGLGITAWLQGRAAEGRAAMARALELDPGHEDAVSWLRRMDAVIVERPPLVRPDRLQYPARVVGDRFEIRTADGWAPFYIKGMNLGATLPGKHPSEFPDSTVYATWIADMSEMGVNTVRVYTIHPPAFYAALERHNRERPDRALWLVHGVWTGLPPRGDYRNQEWEGALFSEMRRVVDVIHGRADLPYRPAHASGGYSADVSRWTLAYIIGREWEPYSVLEFNRRYPGSHAWEGRYLRVRDGNAMDAWLARACEELIAYEVDAYNLQRPISYTNWPTLDPLDHPTETTVDEELAIRRGMGEQVTHIPREYDNDAVGLSAFLVEPTGAFPAGFFAVFHAYPYYPDFVMLDPAYESAASSMGPSRYFGYLRALKARHPGMPIVIAEYGVPASLGVAHLQPQGWHHGGHDEPAMARIDGRLTREIAEAGMAGGMLFAWIDEWFKKNWIVLEFELPPERNRLWLNRLDAEQHYGMIAMEPGEILPGETLGERLLSWQTNAPLYETEAGTLRAAADEAYLWLLLERGPDRERFEELFVGFDVFDAGAGDFAWPGGEGPHVPVGLEFVLRLGEDGVRLLADPPSNAFRIQAVREGLPGEARAGFSVEGSSVPGLFSGRVERRFNGPYLTRPNEDGRYDTLRVVTNRPRFSRDGTEFLALGYDRGILPQGGPPDGLWETLEDEGVVEIRLPWMLLNITDPSERHVLQGAERVGDDRWGALRTRTVDGIRIVAAAQSGSGEWHTWPADGAAERAEPDAAPVGDPSGVVTFSWPTWEQPEWRARRRPVFEEMQRVFESLRRSHVASGETP